MPKMDEELEREAIFYDIFGIVDQNIDLYWNENTKTYAGTITNLEKNRFR